MGEEDDSTAMSYQKNLGIRRKDLASEEEQGGLDNTAEIPTMLILGLQVLGNTVNGTTYAGMRARTTGAPQNHWFGPAGPPLSLQFHHRALQDCRAKIN